MPSRMILLVGLPGSGKTTWAKSHLDMGGVIRYRINWDELRTEMGFHTFKRAEEEAMQEESFRRAQLAGVTGVKEIIVDNTNLNEKTRGRWESLAEQNGWEYEEKWFNQPVDLCVLRDSYREGKAQVGRTVIERMALFAGLIEIPPSLSKGMRNLVILDIDGTVANLTHRRGILCPKCFSCLGTGRQPDPNLADMDIVCGACNGKGHRGKDWYNFYKHVSRDTPIQPILDLATTLRNAGYRILIVSGRPINWGDLEIGKETVAWLKKHNVIYDHIFMRAGGDAREDTVVKQEILDKLPKDRIAYVLDDRSSVISMWRRNGLTALQVAPGDF